MRIARILAAIVGIVALTLPGTNAAQQPAAATQTAPAPASAAASGAAASPAVRAELAYFQTLATFLFNRDHQKAEQGFLRVTQIDAGYAPAWFNLGVFAESGKDWTKAKVYFETYLRVAPTGPDADRAKGQLQLLAKYISGAITPEHERQAEYDATIQRARVFLAMGLYRESIAEAGRAEAADNSRWEAYAVVALCMARQHKHDEAAKFEALAVSHAPADKRDQIQAALAPKIAESNPTRTKQP
jgi:tetratricopeptide (TPR) repeat protein